MSPFPRLWGRPHLVPLPQARAAPLRCARELLGSGTDLLASLWGRGVLGPPRRALGWSPGSGPTPARPRVHLCGKSTLAPPARGGQGVWCGRTSDSALLARRPRGRRVPAPEPPRAARPSPRPREPAPAAAAETMDPGAAPQQQHSRCRSGCCAVRGPGCWTRGGAAAPGAGQAAGRPGCSWGPALEGCPIPVGLGEGGIVGRRGNR